GAQRTLAAGCVIVLIGAEPRTEWLAGPISLHDHGFLLPRPALPARLSPRPPWGTLGGGPVPVRTGPPSRFSGRGVRSAGAPAVGEGGMAVRFVAEHLARSLHPGQGAATARA